MIEEGSARSRPLVARVLLLGLGAAGVSFVLAEVAVRWIVPAEALTPLSNVYVVDSVTGYRLRESLDANAMNVHLVTDDRGFRGSGHDSSAADGVLRIALLGDEHAFGYGVDARRAVAARLEHHVERGLEGRDCEVLNFGVPGYNAAQQLAVFEAHVLDFAPEVVVVMSSEDDDRPAARADDEGWLVAPSSQAASREARLAPPQELTFDARMRGSLGGLRLYRLANYIWLKYSMRARAPSRHVPSVSGRRRPWLPEEIPAANPADTLREAVERPLARILQQCEERGIRVILAPYASSPEWRTLFRDLSAASNRVELVELLSLFPETSSHSDLVERFGLGWDSHLGPIAHDRWGRALATAIQRL